MTAMENNNKTLNVPNLRFPEFFGEWEKCSLGEIGHTSIGLTYSPADVAKEDGIIVLRSSNIQDGEIDYKDLVRVNKKIKDSLFTKKDDILICARNGSPRLIGKNALISDVDAGHSYGAFMMVYRSEENPFVRQLLCTKRYFAQVGENLGARINQITTSDMNSFEFFFPQSKEERNKIALFLRIIDERISTQKKIINKYESLIRGLTDNAFNRNISSPKISFSNLYKDAGEGGTPSTSNSEYYEGGAIPFIKIDDLVTKYLVTHKDCITELGLHKSSAWLIPSGSVIYSNGATIGSISINTFPVCTKQGILGIIPKDNVNVEYLYYFMTSIYFRKEIHRIITEGTMKTAYLKDINKILCPLPCLEKQNTIANRISHYDKKIELDKRVLSLFQTQKK